MIIRYKDLIDEYMSGLVNKLRGFGPKEAFLDTWVPSEDHARSIIDIVESARFHDLNYLTIEINDEDILRSINLEALLEELNKIVFAKLHRYEGGVMLDVCFRKVKTLTALQASDLPVLYRRVLDEELNDEVAKLQQENKDLILIETNHEDLKLQIQVNPKDHVVCAAAHWGAKTTVSRNLLNRLCILMVRKTVNECYDHAVIYLEHELRDPLLKPAVEGITLPVNTWDGFKVLTNIVRETVNLYKTKVGFLDRTNFYNPQPSSWWAGLSESQKTTELKNAIHDFGVLSQINPSDIKYLYLLKDYKVIVDSNPKLESTNPLLLLKLELYLRKSLEFTLCVHTEEETDQNEKRWDRPPLRIVAVSKERGLEHGC